jgi:hypothetical protein
MARIAGGPIAATGLTSRLLAEIIPGAFGAGAALLPPALRALYYPIARASFYDGLKAIFALGVVAALIGMLLTWGIGHAGSLKSPEGPREPTGVEDRPTGSPPR